VPLGTRACTAPPRAGSPSSDGGAPGRRCGSCGGGGSASAGTAAEGSEPPPGPLAGVPAAALARAPPRPCAPTPPCPAANEVPAPPGPAPCEAPVSAAALPPLPEPLAAARRDGAKSAVCCAASARHACMLSLSRRVQALHRIQAYVILPPNCRDQVASYNSHWSITTRPRPVARQPNSRRSKRRTAPAAADKAAAAAR